MTKYFLYIIAGFAFMSCVKEIILPEHVSEFNTTYFDYNPESSQIYLYTEIIKNSYSKRSRECDFRYINLN